MGSVIPRPTDDITEVNLLAGLPYFTFTPELPGGGFGSPLPLGIMDAAALEKSVTLQQLKDFGSGSGKLVRELVSELEATLNLGVFNWNAEVMRYALASSTLVDLVSGNQSIVDEQFELTGSDDPDGDVFIDLANRSLNGGFSTEITNLRPAAIADEVIDANTPGTLGADAGEYALDFKIDAFDDVTEVKATDNVTGGIVQYSIVAAATSTALEVVPTSGTGATSGELQFFDSAGNPIDVPIGQTLEASYDPGFTFAEQTAYYVDPIPGRVRVLKTASNGLKDSQPMEASYDYDGFTGQQLAPFTQNVFQGKGELLHMPDVGINFVWTIPKVSLRITDDELAFSKDSFAVLNLAIQLLDSGSKSAPFGTLDIYDENAA
jgi:hypothetical protein